VSFVLTDDNYYSDGADMEYMSCSQFQGFMECEAKQLAKLQGRWQDEEKEAFLVGRYFHSYFEGKEAYEKFCQKNFDKIFKTKEVTVKKATKTTPAIKETVVTGKYAPFEMADEMIKVAENDPLIKQIIDMEGQNEISMTGYIGETKWRIRMDKYIPDMNWIVDYKTVANIWETSYNPVKQVRQTFVEAYGYLFRAAVYSLIECQNRLEITFDESFRQLKEGVLDLPNFILVCISKQKHPDKEVVRLNHEQEYIKEIEGLLPKLYRYNMIKAGRLLPKRCGVCDYCRATKVLDKIIPYYELMPEFRGDKEDDYAAESMAETF